ncbi:glycerate kinase [Shimia sp. FJ5]|uniref:glycerate kinase type-2 family protein n=1 Tax=Shimia sp. FJ5 TaxID=3079054 RepID=UPI002614089F|nr:DUF4147 domain-containing protein [Shimia sp. FJ5]MDV4143654.1 DUF4147 domain-containing protein [Shimia sp. FJ5]
MDPQMRKTVEDIWWHGVRAVQGRACVARALRDEQVARPDRILAIGKAAAAMVEGAHEVFGADIPALVVTKYGHAGDLPPSCEVIEAAHPVPDENTLIAGHALFQQVQHMSPGTHLLMLVSGGASALAELPEPGTTLASLQAENARMLAEGLDIHAMNARRKELSQIKGGKLLAGFKGELVTTCAISDVEGDALSVIGSGIGNAPEDAAFSFDPFIVASNHIARAAAAERATALGLNVMTDTETLYGDVEDLARSVGEMLRHAPPGVHILGGEPTVILPPDPGQGGRNQALALALSREISGMLNLAVLVGGTDGTDGPTEAAGGIVGGATWREEGARALKRAESGLFLEAHDALFVTGPTGTNVMDLLVALKT